MIKDYIKEGTIKKSNHSVEEKLSIIDKPFQEEWILKLKTFFHLVDKTMFTKSQILRIYQVLEEINSPKGLT